MLGSCCVPGIQDDGNYFMQKFCTVCYAMRATALAHTRTVLPPGGVHCRLRAPGAIVEHRTVATTHTYNIVASAAPLPHYTAFNTKTCLLVRLVYTVYLRMRADCARFRRDSSAEHPSLVNLLLQAVAISSVRQRARLNIPGRAGDAALSTARCACSRC